MTHEEQWELQVLADAEQQGKYYTLEKEPELAATARRLSQKPAPRLLEVLERPLIGGAAVYLLRIREPGKARLRELRLKLLAEQR